MTTETKFQKRKALIARAQGNEPVWNPEEDATQLGKLFNWYSYNKDSSDSFAYFLTYLKNEEYDPVKLEKIQKLGPGNIIISVGWLCRVISLGGLPSEKETKHIQEEITKLETLIQEKKEEKKITVETKQPTIQDRLEEQLNQYITKIDTEIDNFLINECKSDFEASKWFSSSDIKFIHAKRLSEFYEPTLKELKEAQEGKDEQLVEGYNFLSKKQLKEFIAFIEKIIVDANAWYDTAKQISKTNRKPRTKKTRSPLKQIEKLNYLKEHEQLKSISPTSIVGATQLWVYNVKYKQLGVYHCPNDHGLQIKGTSLMNFDIKESIAKTLRKPDEIIPQVLESGKVQLRKVLDNIKAKEKQLTGRINKDTILLKAL